jgi:hypothetical protein
MERLVKNLLVLYWIVDLAAIVAAIILYSMYPEDKLISGFGSGIIISSIFMFVVTAFLAKCWVEEENEPKNKADEKQAQEPQENISK